MHLILLFFAPVVLSSPISLDKRYTAIRIKSLRNKESLHPLGQQSTWASGTRVGTTSCERAALWNANPGRGSVILYNTDLALDAGTGRDNKEPGQLATSWPGTFQQTWRERRPGDARRAIPIKSGHFLPPPPNTAILIHHLVLCTKIPPTVAKDYIHIEDLIWHSLLMEDYPPDARSAVIAYSQPTDGPFAAAQLLNLTSGTNLKISSAFDETTCLDAGYRPGNGALARFTGCGGAARWDWDGEKLRITNSNLCLDVRAESTRLNEILKQLQVWECVEGNTNQEFFTLG
ncbi:uncharacterized protein L199_007796 [Kwoniella botswanensis]|uniref:uncharacterized protein n=1 Tax=Kwoniella botswanensis TaxID=1268659 RepID=UPI00315D5308